MPTQSDWHGLQSPPTLSTISSCFLSYLFLLIGLISIALYTPTSQAETLKNQLSNHPSPYLAMHANDPIIWQDWSHELLQTAQQLKRPILISSGYFSCHWCHVMQQENYQNRDVADLVNQHFIAVKLDRELHADLDHYLIEFSRKVTGRAGWPQHVILTPEGYPFAAFGYQPQKTVMLTLNRLQQAWQTQSQQITTSAKQAINPSQSNKHVNLEDFQQYFMDTLTERLDDLSGGLKGSSKFPNTPLLLALLAHPNPNEEISDWLELTLEQMQNEHLQDHVNGGFYRYTVDPEWQIPHFEKMGYDNALLAQAYFRAGQYFQRDDFIATAEATLSYMQQHLFDKKLGLYAGSQSALDQQGEEGGDYLYTRQQLQKRLTTQQVEHIQQAWSLDLPPPYELGWHPKPTEQDWPTIRAALQTEPNDIPTDDKFLIGWNGLALQALVSGYNTTQKTSLLTQAEALAHKLIQHLKTSNPKAVIRNGSAIGQANLEDVVYVLQGLETLQQASPKSQLTQNITDLKQRLKQQFFSNNRWQQSSTATLPGQSQQTIGVNSAMPNPLGWLHCHMPQDPITQIPDHAMENVLESSHYLSLLSCRSKT